MMKRCLKLRLLVVVLFSAVGCSNAIPTSSDSNFSFKAPSFTNGQTQPVFIIANYNDPITVSGKCDPNTGDIKISLDSGATWLTPPAGTDLNCTADGAYSLTILDCSNSGSFGALGYYGSYGFVNSTATGSIKVQIRSESNIAPSSVSTFSIQHGYSTRLNFASLNSGGTASLKNTAGNYQITQSRLGSAFDKLSVSSTNYKIKFAEDQ